MEDQADRYLELMPELEANNQQVVVLFEDGTGVYRATYDGPRAKITWAFVDGQTA